MRSVILLIALSIIAAITAADETDPEDLGTMTPQKAIALETGTTRKDFRHFLIDCVSLAPSNHISFLHTNELLKCADLKRLPSGPALMSVTAFFADGSHGDAVLYKFDLRRGKPPRASARIVTLLGGPEDTFGATNVDRALQLRRRAAPASPPPLPFQGSTVRAEERPPSSLPLPNGQPTSYAEHLDQEAEKQMRKFYNKNGRRNQ